jgi:hypothetical protein
MVTRIINKIRALVEDEVKSDLETFTYTTSSIFLLSESDIISVIEVTKNGTALGSGEYSYDADTKEVTVSASLTANDIIIISYTYYDYSNTDIKGYIKSALVWISICQYKTFFYDSTNTLIYPTPTEEQENLISLIASILIKPNYQSYRLPNHTVTYPKTMSKEDRIKDTIATFKKSSHGKFDVL